jgi:hypothetical protein
MKVTFPSPDLSSLIVPDEKEYASGPGGQG